MQHEAEKMQTDVCSRSVHHRLTTLKFTGLLKFIYKFPYGGNEWDFYLHSTAGFCCWKGCMDRRNPSLHVCRYEW